MRPRMTPLEIQKREFSRKWKGLDPGRGPPFLVDVAEDMEALARENADLDGRDCARSSRRTRSTASASGS